MWASDLSAPDPYSGIPLPAVLKELNSADSNSGESWKPIDAAAAFAAGLESPKAEVLARKDGLCLFYKGRIHSVIGPPEANKTWLVLLGVVQEIENGNRVMMIDFEDHYAGVASRLLDLGLTQEQIIRFFIYIRPDQKFGTTAQKQVQELIEDSTQTEVTFVAIDGVTEAMSIEGQKTDSDEGVATFYKTLPRWLADLGPAVVMIDHVTKSAESNGSDARGSGHKRGGLDGSSISAECIDKFSRGRHGKSYLTLAKDRPAGVRSNIDKDTIGTFHLVSDPKTFRIEAWIEPPAKGLVEMDGYYFTVAEVQAILLVIKATPGLSQGAACGGLPGFSKKPKQAAAVKLLLEGGFAKDVGSGGTKKLHYVRDYDISVPGLDDDD